MLRCTKALPEKVEGSIVSVIAVDIQEERGELCEGGIIHSASMLLQAVARALAQLLDRPAGLRHADDRHIEVPAADHRLQRRKDHLVREVSCGSEEDERVGYRCRHEGFSECPPNW